ncbi:MAG: Fic family protein [Bacillota bacterium]
MLKDKYQLNKEDSIFLAKRLMVDSIWKTANLEGIAVTFPDTQVIFDGMTVNGYRVDELIAINNIKKSWFFIIDNIDYDIDFEYICHVNKIVGGEGNVYKAGQLRNFDVAIGGTSWKPEKPVKEEIESQLFEILSEKSTTERAIDIMLYIMRKQMFCDGNKRTAQICANQVMISGGAGIISIPIEHQSHFTKLLVEYYESAEDATIKQFVFDNCIFGMDKY